MAKAETLAEVKRAEDEVRRAREDAQTQAARILKDARVKAEEVLRKAAEDADALHREALAAAQRAAAAEREKILATGRREADSVATAATGPKLDTAASLVTKRFQDSLKV